MNILSNYKIGQKIYFDSHYQIYRGIRRSDLVSVLIKSPNHRQVSLEAITCLKNEHLILQKLDSTNIIKSYKLEKHKNSYALVLEDFSGKYLDQFLASKTLSTPDFFTVAIKLVEIIQELHQRQIIHKNIQPASIVIEPQTLKLKITNFTIATSFTPEISNSAQELEISNLAYISPEQTGRMNLTLDHRTDLYSLGIVFYQMLTGQLPYQGQNSLQLIHAHLAQTPISPHQLNSDIDATVAAIILKLLAKNPEDRYQTAVGLQADLETCQLQYLSKSKIEPFDLGKLDRRHQFIIPQQLYGRSSAITNLIESWLRVCSGAAEMILVSGNPGIGKTAVIEQVAPTIVEQGYFVSGKFEQLNRNIPYGAIIQAFHRLIQQLLTETPEQLKIWQKKILSVVGQNGKIITDILPELEWIIGTQPDILELATKETENRFHNILEEFIRVFAAPEQPLVLFLDDLQWADAASTKLLDSLLRNSRSQYLLVIGSYRDNEVNSAHLLEQTIEDLRQNIPLTEIELKPLTIDQINQLLVDTLHCQPDRSLSLAKLLSKRTSGNPFFLNQLLKSLYAEGLVRFNFESLSWQWQVEEIKLASISNYDMLELVARNLAQLPNTSREILELAACIGNQFDLATLAVICAQNQAEIVLELNHAIQAGIILLLQEKPTPIYRFLHNHVQQTAYSLLDGTEKIQAHFKIGQFLLQQNSAIEEEKIFDLVNHLNISRELLLDDVFTLRLAELNLIAAQRAKATTAYEVAADYLDLALELLSPWTWSDNYDLMSDVYLEAIEVQYLQTNFVAAQKLSNIFLSQVDTVLEQVKVYKIRIHAYIARNQMQLAIDTGMHVLKLLQVSLPDIAPDNEVLPTPLDLSGSSIESLKTLPEMTDPISIAAMEILTIIIPPVYIVKPQLFPLVVLTMIDLCLQAGNSRLSAFAYVVYALLLCAMGEIDAGYQLGKLALTVQEQFKAKEIKSKVDFTFNNMVRHWREPAISTIDHFLVGIDNGIEVGDIEHACFHAKYYCTYLFFVGEPLPSADIKSSQQIEMIQNFKQDFQLNYARIWRQLNLNLQGLAEDKLRLIGKSFDESKMLPLWLETNNATSLFALYLAKLILCYFLKDYQQAIVNARQGKQYLKAAIGTMCFSVYHFYSSLAMLAVYREQSASESGSLSEIVSYQQQLKQWASHAPNNYLHKYELVTAEIARVLGKKSQAEKHYDIAIAEAAKAGYTQEVALAEELTGEFYLSLGKTKIAGFYLTDAYYEYWRWGALAKVQNLEDRYAELLVRIPTQQLARMTFTQEQSSNQPESLATLDLFSVIKTSQAISSEIILDNLLSKMMEIVMENAGAQKSILFLQRDSKWTVAASATINPKKQVVLPYVPLAEYPDIPNSIINYIQSTRETVILDQASQDGIFTQDPYVVEHQPKSILACPMIYQNQLQGIIYLENSLVRGAFTPNKLEILKVLLSQVSISIENARLYKNLENHASVKKSLEQKEILLKEIHHRVKNNLFVVSSLLEFQSSYIDDPEVIKLLENCQSRITSMALVHQHLYGNSKLDKVNFAQYLESLLDNLAYAQSSQERNINLMLDIDAIELNIETANPCGLIVNELVSNALEHGFKNRDRGNICLSLKHNSEGKITLTIEDDGVGFGDDLDLYNNDSLGLELVCTLVEQLDGTIKLDKTSGTKIGITFEELDYRSRI